MIWKSATRRWQSNKDKLNSRNLKRGLLVGSTCVMLTLGSLCAGMPVMAAPGDAGESGSDETVVTGMSDMGGIEDVFSLTNDCQYDRINQRFHYRVSGFDGTVVIASVADGMVVQESVTLEVNDNFDYTLFKGKDEVELDGYEVVDPGEYRLQLIDGNGKKVFPVSFTIVGEASNLKAFKLPDTCSFTDVYLDGEEVGSGRRNIELKEGRYEIDYMCNGTDMRKHIVTNVDYTAPELELKGVKDGVAKGPVSVRECSEEAYVSVFQGEKEIKNATLLKQSGAYHVVVTDFAGNASEYDFKIAYYFNIYSVLFIVCILLCVFAMMFYIHHAKTKIRVR